MFKKLFSLFAVVACLALVVAAPVMAQALSPTGDTYSGVAGQLQGGGGGGGDDNGANPVASDDSGNLPFTGFELSLAVALGAGLLGTGFVLRRGLRTTAS